MADKIRICKITGMELPAGTPVTFQGNKVGHAIRGNEIVIDNEMVYTLIRGNEVQFSLEVVRK